MIFYTPGINGFRYTLNEEESGHAVRVLRLKTGDKIVLVDGQGGWYEAVVVMPHPKHCEVEVTSVQQDFGKRPYSLHMGIAPTKNIDRFEWFVEKATEIGIDEITPLLCEHSERRHLNIDRLQRVMISAMKQSQKAYLPRINEVAVFDQWLKTTSGGNCFIAYCGEGNKPSLRTVYQPEQDVVIAIGPEGDFSTGEVSQALACGYQGIGLGTSRLRTETAGVVACHSVYFVNE